MSPGADPTRGVRVLVGGRVQGVGFRWATVQEARRAGVTGWVRNLPDGRVEAHVQGAEGRVETLLVWLHHRPAGARVESVELADVAPDPGLTAFEHR